MATLEELERRNYLLKIKKESKEELKELGKKRKELEKENYWLAHEKKAKLLNTSKNFGKEFILKSKIFYKNYAPRAKILSENINNNFANTSLVSNKSQKKYAKKVPNKVNNILGGNYQW